MIGRIHGKLIEKHPPLLLVDVNGIGYEIEAPMSTFYDLPQIGETVTLRTHFLVREDAQLLFGFGSEAERETFRELIKISGIGAKVALSILSGMSVDELINCINDKNITALTRIPGIGKKTAERLTLEMRDRLKQLDGSGQSGTSAKAEIPPSSSRDDALHALLALGYKTNEADKMISLVFEEGMDTENIIRNALKNMAR